MSVETSTLIQAARVAMHKAKIARGAAKKREKNELERMTAAIQLLVDDLKGEGVDINTPEGRQIFQLVLLQKLAKFAKSGDRDFDLGGWPEGM